MQKLLEDVIKGYVYGGFYFTTLFCLGFEGIYLQLKPEYRQPLSNRQSCLWHPFSPVK